ncbi:hypothetical protein GUI12_03185 [Anaplasmataceae bacterium AB001_6]|nr:hypothetical protein GUI12_03185 [Anaplasmataceae bacterium AB001_6]
MTIVYEQILNDSLINAIKRIFDLVVYNNYDYDFFVTFKTNHKGCVIEKEVLKKYPELMSIILKKDGEMSNFHDLRVDSNCINVILEFDDINQNTESHIIIPFHSIIMLSDRQSDFLIEISEDAFTEKVIKNTAPENKIISFNKLKKS